MTPPIALFCVGRMNGSHRHLTIGKRIGISILASGQSALAARFAQKSTPGGYVDIVTSESDAGVPVISGAIAAVEATVREIVAAGDHTVFLCNLDRAVLGSDAEPLLYVRRTYHALGEAKD
jgi:flavin reductase (DIM6/NTAB) family NADH-FMN oxidoreductase RutF